MKILIADDHDLVRDALEALINREGFNADVIKTKDLDSAIEKGEGVNVALIDLNMPGMNGIKGIKRFASRFVNSKVILMSGNASRAEVEQALEFGAQGFIPKTMSGVALVNAIKIVDSGEKYIHPSIYSEKNSFDKNELKLTQRELDVLKQLFHGISNKEIATALNIQEPTVKLHLRSLCDKFVANNRTDLIIKAIKEGYGDL